MRSARWLLPWGMLAAAWMGTAQPVSAGETGRALPPTHTGTTRMNDSVTQESLRSYLVSLVCETDFVNQLGPVKASLIFLSLAVLPPEGQQRWHNTLQNQWREVFAALPASQQPPFSLAAYATAMRAGKIRSLEEQVVAGLTPACRERLKVLGTGPDEGPAYRETMLTKCLTSLLHHWRISGETRLGLERFDRLPDLLALAHASNARDRYAEQDRLAREHDAQKKPYRLSMPYRQPGHPCSSGEPQRSESRRV